jgi:protein Tex
MIDLSGIARQLHLSIDQIRLAADLIEQGYAPSFISRYRADETGSLPKAVLWRLKLHIDHQKRLDAARQRVGKQLPKDVGLDPEANRCIENARTVVAIEAVLKSFRARRALDQTQERDSSAGKLLEKMLTYGGAPIDNLTAWAGQEVQGDEEAGKSALAQVTRLLGTLIQCDTGLNLRLRQAIQRRASVRVEDPPVVQASPSNAATPTSAPKTDNANPQPASGSTSEVASAEPTVNSALCESNDTDDAAAQSCMTDEAIDVAELAQDAAQTEHEAHHDHDASADEAEHHDGESDHHDDESESGAEDSSKPSRGKRNTKLTPRQRRRRWLTTMLAPLRSINKPLNKLTAYQHLMLGRGVRSQLIATPLEYDRGYVCDLARDSFADNKHPLAAWFSEATAKALDSGILAKLEIEALAEMEEEASESLLEHATDELRLQLMRRPVRGHTIALVDTVGPKTVAVVVVDPNGGVLASEELPCSVQPEVVNQNVVKLGELIHKHRVTLIALTNGPARRFMVSTLRELMVQSKDSGLRWTMADRSGAEAYAGGRIGLKELANFNRRERAAIWAARCLQNPLVELLKVDTSRLRLGSYQRELPQEPLKQLVHDTIVDCVCSRGIDVLHASENELQYVPGVGAEQAKQIVQLSASGALTNRNQLKELVANWPETNQRQAIAWLRVFESSNSLDATLIHPEDYRLAERLVENTELTAPPSAPPGWTKRVAKAAAAKTETTLVVDSTDTPENAGSNASESAPVESSESSSDENALSQQASESDSPVASSQDVSVDAEGSTDAAVSAEASNELAEEQLSFKSVGKVEVEAKRAAPEYPEQVAAEPIVAPIVDAEKLANQWQVGRAKLKTIAAALQDPFADPRLQQPPVPLSVDLPVLENLEPDTCVWAIVVGVADFGAFVELGPNCSGLIHISRLSTHFIEDPHQCVQVGDLLMTWVVNVDKKKNRVALTALSPAQRAEVQAATEQRKAQAEQERANRFGPRGGGDRGQRRDGGQGQGARQGHSQGTGQTGQGSRQGQGQGQNQGQGQGQGQGNQARRADSAGSRSGQSGQGTRGGQDGQRGGNRAGGRDRGQGGRGRGRGDAGDRPAKSIVVQSKKPVAPISKAMKEGDEPLRSFSDLMQFYESKRTTPDEVVETAVKQEPPTSVESDTPVIDASSPSNSSEDVAQ